MSEQALATLELQLREAAQALPYPSTPNLAGAVQARLRATRAAPRRLAWVVAAVALVAAGLLSVPQVRAAVADVIRIGVVSIFVGTPTATPAQIPQATATQAARTPVPTVTATALPTPSSVLDLQGEVTLQEAVEESGFTIRLPAYPADLGQPDRVIYQDQGGPVVVLIWLDPADPEKVRLSLHMLASDSWGVLKLDPPVLETTRVNDKPAVWTEGPYMMFINERGGLGEVRLIEGHVLIWTEGSVTYRLETDVELDEAVRIAESLE